MAQDIKDLLRKDAESNRESMPAGHREEFMELLDREMPGEKKGVPVFWLRIAAGFMLVLAAGAFVYYQQVVQFTEVNNGVVDTEKTEGATDKTNGTAGEQVAGITLGDLSPDLGKIENYYLANINMELASLEMNEETEQLISGYMTRLGDLNDEYKALTKELNEIGPNQQTVDALINNLQLRLDLLYRLKDQLQELKQEENEKFNMQEA